MDAKDRIIEQRIARRRQKMLIIKSLIALMLLIIVVCLVLLVRAGVKDGAFHDVFSHLRGAQGSSGPAMSVPLEETEKETPASKEVEEKLARAQQLRAQYDYQAAIDLLTADPAYDTTPALVKRP